ncbi:hypothetical protein B0H17DRAFT_1137167 [Mycena rosella]|uniref:Uncharacterized protein n=1 Tax=Mycena rosella TaxID=1033263 RepID=A0AAD7D927_MYCRO|nr:hypothetical protein B0H17DRAFT_1137167 [Mycena rosella]
MATVNFQTPLKRIFNWSNKTNVISSDGVLRNRDLECGPDFHAPDLPDEFASFLESKYIVPRLEHAANTVIFPVYKRVSISLPLIPEVGSRDVYDKIRAVKGEPSKLTAKGGIPAKAGHFDTVLVRTQPRDDGNAPTDVLPPPYIWPNSGSPMGLRNSLGSVKKAREERRVRMRLLGRAGR